MCWQGLQVRLRLQVTKLGMTVFGSAASFHSTSGMIFSVLRATSGPDTGIASPCREAITHRVTSVFWRLWARTTVTPIKSTWRDIK